MKINVPFVIRDAINQALDVLQLAGIPLPFGLAKTLEDSPVAGSAEAFWPGGFRISTQITVRQGHYGQEVTVHAILFRWGEVGVGHKASLEEWAGPCAGDEGELRTQVTVDGDGLLAARCNVSWRRNGLRTYKWDDPEHPRLYGYGNAPEGRIEPTDGTCSAMDNPSMLRPEEARS